VASFAASMVVGTSGLRLAWAQTLLAAGLVLNARVPAARASAG
jgi:hypothetical protein